MAKSRQGTLPILIDLHYKYSINEFEEFYEKAAERNGTTWEEEFEKAQRLILNIENKVRLPSESMTRDLEEKREAKVEEFEKAPELHPKVVGLCAQADKDQGPMRIQAGDFIEELETLEDELSIDDWEFVMSKGVYKTVKNFASKQVDVLTDGEDDEE